jgi:SAM-dependent methyltransferase
VTDDHSENTFLAQSRYLELKYSDERAPQSAYPDKLASWLLANVYERPGALLDLGSGRGDHLAAFARLGFDVTGVDISPRAVTAAERFTVLEVDLEHEPLPFDSESFDFLFSKSVLEHIQNATSFLAGAREVLRHGGKIALLTPSWKHMHGEAFYSEYTHVRPFTLPSLGEALTLAGFEDVSVRYFRQLPVTWRSRPARAAAAALGRLPLPYRPLHAAPWPQSLNKTIRFSREVLLLATATRA